MKPKRVPSSKGDRPSEKHRTKKESMLWKMLGSAGLVVLVAITAQKYYHNHIYLPSIISQKTDLPQLGINIDRKAWGTYRSHMYFGLRTPHPESPLFGLIWYEQPGVNVMVPPVRHWCDKSEGIKSYGWSLADGRSFGKQTVKDANFDLSTEWVNEHDTWTARIKTSSTSNTKVALIPYLLLEDVESFVEPLARDDKLTSIKGYSKLLGNFVMKFDAKVSINERSFLAESSLQHLDATNLKEAVIASTEVDRERESLRLPNAFFASEPGKAKFIAVQINLPMNGTLEISFSTDQHKALTGESFEKALQERSDSFTEKFERIYGLTAQGFSGFYQFMGRSALSNMLGSIGFSTGFNRVQSRFSNKLALYGKHELLTACPSRSTFPRGFLWDEGFHHLLIKQFDPELSLQIISSWLDTMNVEGWIPREMILNKEDESLVPSEFLVQRDSIANPPMFFYLLQRFLDDAQFMKAHGAELVRLYPRLRLWHSWLNSTQTGPKPGTYRWHGRNATTQLELNPKTLPSGLDDYPRATHPTDDEYHIDIRCWMTVAAKTLEQLARMAKDESQAKIYESDAAFLTDFDLLKAQHWSEKEQRFCDYGLHSASVELQRKLEAKETHRNPNPNQPPPPMLRSVKDVPRLRLVENTFGYMSLYPVMLKLVPHDAHELKVVLENMRAEEGMWSKYGLRSLSKTSPYYKAHNTEHDPPYWRGSIWINVNYMMLSALKHYSAIKGPNQELAFQIYSELRNNVVSNIVREFKRTGYLWENYDDETGKGRGAHPFTGWTALVLSIMSEQYN